MNSVTVLQLGAKDLRTKYSVHPCAKWYYEPDLKELPERSFDILLLDRAITEEELQSLLDCSSSYRVFVTELPAKDPVTRRLCFQRAAKVLTQKMISSFLQETIPLYFPGSYGEKLSPSALAISPEFRGKVRWQGFQGAQLEGNYGEELKQVAFWRLNLPIEKDQNLDLWLEYAKEPSIQLEMEITQFYLGSVSGIQKVMTFSEEELSKVITLKNELPQGTLFISLRAKGAGRLSIVALHSRHSRAGVGEFIPGGKRYVSSEREEVFGFFDPGNLKPPLNVYFSGYKTQEGFEGFYMMRSLGHPFLLISESRLEGGAFYLGSKEYEDMIEQLIRETMEKMGFDSSQVILSGLSMGTFGAMYYGCRIHPHTILIGKPLASLGDVAQNERIDRPGGFPTSLDVLHKACGGMGTEEIERLNARFWNEFDQTDWKGTDFAVAYMYEDDYDGTAYASLQTHLKSAGARIYGKGLHGIHNDNTSGIVSWFVNRYKKILKEEFDHVR